MRHQFQAGLRDVEAVESSITAITPEGLFYRGVPLDECIERATFEEVAFLLWHGARPSTNELGSFRKTYARAWVLPPNAVSAVQALPLDVEPLAALQAVVPLLAHSDPERVEQTAEGQAARAIRILAQVPATLACRHWGTPVARLDPATSLAAQVLRALGSKPMPPRVADAALILFADHELAASTFAARIAAAALSSAYDGLAAALAVLRGPLHGGSIADAAATLRRLVAARELGPAIDGLLAERRRIAGFGHSVYRGGDPRAPHFRRLAEQIATGEARQWIETAVELERRVEREHGLYANVDLYAAAFMHAADLKDNAMVTLFAVARTAGWLAHIIEQQENNRLIRPRARYTGEIGRAWIGE